MRKSYIVDDLLRGREQHLKALKESLQFKRVYTRHENSIFEQRELLHLRSELYELTKLIRGRTEDDRGLGPKNKIPIDELRKRRDEVRLAINQMRKVQIKERETRQREREKLRESGMFSGMKEHHYCGPYIGL